MMKSIKTTRTTTTDDDNDSPTSMITTATMITTTTTDCDHYHRYLICAASITLGLMWKSQIHFTVKDAVNTASTVSLQVTIRFVRLLMPYLLSSQVYLAGKG